MERVEVPHPRFATAMGIAGCVLLLPLTLLLFGLPPSPGTVSFGSLATHLALRALVVAVLGYLLVVALLDWRDRRPLLVIDAEGIWSRRIRPAPLKWRDVAGARRMKLESVPDQMPHDLLCIRLSDPSTLESVLDFPAGLIGWLQRWRRIAGCEIQLDLSTTNADVPDLVRLINANCGRRDDSGRAR